MTYCNPPTICQRMILFVNVAMRLQIDIAFKLLLLQSSLSMAVSFLSHHFKFASPASESSEDK